MFNATLKFKGKEFDVRYVDYLIERDVDAKGRPASHLYGGLVRMIIESTEDTTILEIWLPNSTLIVGLLNTRKVMRKP